MPEKTTISLKILLVDDEPSQMELTKLNLEQTDPTLIITVAPTPQDALTEVQVNPFDCIVSDYIMPGINGIELFTKIKKRKTIPFIIYTARGSDEVAALAFDAGIDDYVRKEPNLAHYLVLVRRIRHAVEKKRAEAGMELANKELIETNIGLKESYNELIKVKEVVQENARKLEGMVQNGKVRLHDSEERLHRLQQMDTISRIGATVAHDLRAPLVTISQASEMARAKQELSDKMLELISENAKRSLEMIEEFREGTREVKPVKMRVDLSSLVMDFAKGLVKPDNVALDVQSGEGLGDVFVDPGLIRRVLENLVRNGVEAMPDGGKLTVSVKRDEHDAVILVSDSGVGVREEDRKHIFEPLFTTKRRGLGLGLYFVRIAVESHGGTVSFDSKLGYGTTFKIILPIE